MLQCVFQCGAKIILPLVFHAGGNTETIATLLREVYYRLAIRCDICKSFASMSTQSVLDHYSEFCVDVSFC